MIHEAGAGYAGGPGAKMLLRWRVMARTLRSNAALAPVRPGPAVSPWSVAALAAALALGACACPGAAATGLAWPAPSTTAEDGGESLAPRRSGAAASLETSQEPSGADEESATGDDPSTDASAPAADATTPGGGGPAEASPAAPAADDPIVVDEQVIEIDD